jgi:hypothetical protein
MNDFQKVATVTAVSDVPDIIFLAAFNTFEN